MKRLLFVACCMIIVTHTQAQTADELQKEMDQMLSGMQMEMDLFKENIQKDFQQFVAEQDKAFKDMLEQNWQEFQLFSGQVREGKKPPTPPTASPDDKTTSSTIPLGDIPAAGKTPPAPVRVPKGTDPPAGTTLRAFSFFGTPVSFTPDQKLGAAYRGNMQEKEIAAYWIQLSETAYDDLLSSLFTTRDKMGLNDWGFYALANALATSIHTNDQNSARLLTWFLLNKGGYRARLGINGNQVVLLMPFQQEVYEIPYVEKGGLRYYAMHPVQGSLRTYEGEFSEGNQPLDLRLMTSPSFAQSEIKQRTVNFTVNRNSYEFPLRYNQGLIDFYNEYPLTDIEVYFDASLSWEMKEDLFTHFAPILGQLEKEEDQVQVILDFIYQSLPYMTDDDQFGRERYFFAEETIAYPYSDCEDRAVLFSHMVELLMNCPTIGIYYPNHISAAVHLTNFKGDAVKYNYGGRDFISCDPTYIHSLVGMAMSGFNHNQAKVIPVSTFYRNYSEEETLWDNLLSKGRFPGSPNNKFIPADGNKYYVCGYDASGSAVVPFIGKTDIKGNFDWVHTIETGSDLLRPALFAEDNRIYFTGQTTSAIRFAGKEASQPDEMIFLAALRANGQVDWLQAYQPEMSEGITAYLYTLGTNGELQDQMWFPETGEMEAIAFSHNGTSLTLSGILSYGEGLATASANVTHNVASAAVPEMLHTINNKLVADNTDEAIAGVFAFIELLTKPGQKIQGTDVVAALDKYNPSFKQKCPVIYKNIAAISLVVNESGVITVQTDNGKAVNFDKVRVQSGSKINLRTLPTKDIKLEIIDGVKVGAAIIWFKLNHVILYRESGDLLFDYDKKHTTQTFNLKKDILN